MFNSLSWSSPFPVRRDSSTAILFVHGFLTTPTIFTYLSRRIDEAVAVSQFATVLPGHGATPSRLRQTSREDWYRVVRRDFNNLTERYDRVVICGMSLGGLLSYALVQEFTPSGVVLLAPAFRYRFQFFKWGADTLGRVLPYVPQCGLDGLSDRTLAEYYPHYMFIPLKSVREISRLQEEIEERFRPSNIDCPVLTLQSVSDWVIDHEAAVSVARQCNHPQSTHRLFEKSNHVLPLDYDRQQVAGEIIDFLDVT